MALRWIIVDGYSLLHRMRPRSTAARRGDFERRRLITQLEKAAPLLADRVTLVFDGRGNATDTAPESAAIEVVYSPAHQTADTVIERIVCSATNREEILVVTSDRAERHTVEAAGAMTISCGDFLEQCRRIAEQLDQRTRGGSRDDSGPKLGDFFPSPE